VASLRATYIVQTRIKPIFRRVRPFVNREARVVGIRPADHSFPSGHTASSFAAATALAFFYPRAAPLAFGLATAVGVSRVHLGVHFPSDAAVGGLMGYRNRDVRCLGVQEARRSLGPSLSGSDAYPRAHKN